MDNVEHSKTPILNLVLRAALVSLLLQSVLTPIILVVQHSGRGGVAPLGFASFVLTSATGFLCVGRRVTAGQALGIGVVYFPTVFGLMFLEAIFLDGRLYGNTF